MNDVMSMGIHRIWKDAMMDWLAPRDGQRLLDGGGRHRRCVFPLSSTAHDRRDGHRARHDGADAVEGQMRAEATQKADMADWIVGDAMALPFRGHELRPLHDQLRHPQR